MPRARRASAPSRVAWGQLSNTVGRQRASANVSSGPCPPSVQAPVSDGHSDVKVNHIPVNPLPSTYEHARDQQRYSGVESDRKQRGGILDETPPIANLPAATPSFQRLASVFGIRRPSKRHDEDARLERTTSTMTLKSITKLSTKSSRSLTHIIIDFNDTNSNTDTSAPPQRTLRRKKHMSIFRSSTPDFSIASGIQRPQSQPPPSLLSSAPTHTRSQSQPLSAVRLGHPSRPYYTAIRKNMSRPTSLIDDTSARPLSFASSISSQPTSMYSNPGPAGILSLINTTPIPEALDDGDDLASMLSAGAPRTTFSLGRAHSRLAFAAAVGAGCSVSGETEMRMALARRRSDAAYRDRGSGATYEFQDMKKTHTHGRGLMRRVKKLRQGITDLLSWHS
ncbi:hypothetical protein BD779DRAFT_1668418 [Infundibulicybe gibba]|nr:hypothetical protein BD779DRAFT_1668418 [Infundibulicybe gibba]